MNEAVKKTLIFAVVLIVGGLCGCVAGAVAGETPSIVFGTVGAACGVILATLSVLAHRKTRP
jgi:uncharacterized membrane protein YeaQ/YmgE (transglycosylase-associated protein family)